MTMSLCGIDVIRKLGSYLNVAVDSLCYNTDKVLTIIIGKRNVEGFINIVLQLAYQSGSKMTDNQKLLSYQWLEYLVKYSDQTNDNSVFAKSFLQEVNRHLEKKSYLTGHFLTITDVVAYFILSPLLHDLNVAERESLLHLCRWARLVQAQPTMKNYSTNLSLDSIFLYVNAPAVH